ncbi:hypothetical protein BGZ68_008805, partial [Mortierella alpina]
MKSAAGRYSQPCEPKGFKPTKRGMQAADEDSAVKEAKRNARLLQLRNELLADMSSSDDDQPMTSFRNPFKKMAETQTEAPVPQPIIKAKDLEGTLTTRHDVPHSADLDDEEPDGLLSEAELVLLGRVRRLVEASAPRPKKNTVVRPEVVPPEKPPSIFPLCDTVARHADEEKGSNPDPRIKPPVPYDKEYHRRQRHRRCEKTDARGKATEEDHDGKDLDDASNSGPCASQTRDQEAPAEESKDHEGAQRTSHNGLQIRSQVVPKRHVRSIPGRFSALDSDEEEEWFRQYDMEQAKRKAQREAQGTSGNNGSPTVALGIANGLQQRLPSDAVGQVGQAGRHGQQSGYPGNHGVPNYRLPPQIYPTLQYGRRTRLYHPKLDE